MVTFRNEANWVQEQLLRQAQASSSKKSCMWLVKKLARGKCTILQLADRIWGEENAYTYRRVVVELTRRDWLDGGPDRSKCVWCSSWRGCWAAMMWLIGGQIAEREETGAGSCGRPLSKTSERERRSFLFLWQLLANDSYIIARVWQTGIHNSVWNDKNPFHPPALIQNTTSVIIWRQVDDQ